MRLFTTLFVVLLLSALALGQAVVVGGTAPNGPITYDVYAAPFVPRIVTPSVSLTTVSPSPVGASNATFGNVAGATNSTLSMPVNGAPSVYTQAVMYPSAAATPVLYVQSSGVPMQSMAVRHSDIGVASLESEVSAKQLMAWSGPAKKASRTYTNQDVDRFNQGTGTVKYSGKTEQIK
jgi:hypothetical protein